MLANVTKFKYRQLTYHIKIIPLCILYNECQVAEKMHLDGYDVKIRMILTLIGSNNIICINYTISNGSKIMCINYTMSKTQVSIAYTMSVMRIQLERRSLCEL